MQSGSLSNGAMEYDNSRALLLIELYRRHRALWDPKDALYYSKGRKAQAWAEVAARVGGSVPEVRRKMESLLGSFRRERSRAARTAGRGRKHYTSSWFAYDRMRFLIDRDNPKRPKRDRIRTENQLQEEPMVGGLAGADDLGGADAAPFLDGLHSAFGDVLLDAQALEATEAAAGMAGPVEPLEMKQSPLVQPRANRNSAPWIVAASPQHDGWRTRRSSSKPVIEMAAHSEEDRDDFTTRFYSTQLNDEAAVFGQYLANKLRKYSQRTRAIVEHLVSNVLFEADMGKHDVAPAEEDRRDRGRLHSGRIPPVTVTYRPPCVNEDGAMMFQDSGDDEDEDGVPEVKLEPEQDAADNCQGDEVDGNDL